MYMAATTPQKYWAAADLRAIPEDGKRYEIIDGELFVSPSPTFGHQRLVMRLLVLLHAYAETHRIGEVLPSPADIELADDTVVQPDVFVLPPTDGTQPRRWEDRSVATCDRGTLSSHGASGSDHKTAAVSA
jgi:Uma2 family endonuclease